MDEATKTWHDKEIKDVCSGDIVLSRDEESGEDILIKVIENHYHGKLKLFAITLDTGEKVTCTMNHKFRTKGGMMVALHRILEQDLEIVVKTKG
jgi:hypothetical protein